MTHIKRALLTTADKSKIAELAHALSALGVEIISTGGTAKILKQSEIQIREVEELTGFPEILEGRVKTLHPKIFGGILAIKDRAEHSRDLKAHEIESIDLVAVNLYPFTQALEEGDLTEEDLLEYIDIGGVSLIRAAAKNYKHVIVLCDAQDYGWVAEELKGTEDLSLKTRRMLAAKAYYHTAYYDSSIAHYLKDVWEQLPNELTLGLKKDRNLRYGENPQQKAALYRLTGGRPWGLASGTVLHGKPLSFNNYLDLEAAWNAVSDFSEPACIIIKHATPCGAALAEKLSDALELAFAADPLSAFGGVIAFNREVDPETAGQIIQRFIECVAAPEFSQKALDILRMKKDLRLVSLPSQLVSPYELDCRPLSGGFLVQEKDLATLPKELRVVTQKKPSELDWLGLKFAWRIVKHAKSNAIVIARGGQTLGIGSGQTSRIDALKSAVAKINERHPILEPGRPLGMASDGFFPFKDCVEEAAKAGVSAIIQPGGSIRDGESIEACDQLGLAMVFTGLRHFKH
ncbi:MAG: bifunctional phosphoribosylaminoimidazolecarboxamide formyltransferase/IMP cyclohydrolase [Elusimicrobia bacterium]|nr:bifunctional phosphoribosylaminoimidazolecarboxamide formyltransferase/IMP cyclohydrolase [Elusimicrobiota bacterium]